ncbi:MAG: FAD-dependent thymidylate synthase [Clostridia bacterium]|nr:FAD-dependent thymidylate synthase [Clostridia bacterium]
MNITIAASTKEGYMVPKQELDKFGGSSAGVCYMPLNFEALKNEPFNKTMDRSNDTKLNMHHSVYGHTRITFDIENVPKLFAMLLNNEKVFDTSEKSARYTKMELTKDEQFLYDKWLNKFIVLITEKFGDKTYFTKRIIEKLAMENARYFTSVMTSSSMRHTVSYRQLNYLCGWMEEFKNSDNSIYKMLAPTANEFIEKMKNFGYLDRGLMNDGKDREFSFVGKRVRQEQFGECYSVNYKASFVSLAQAQRHRTLHYEMMQLDKKEYFVPLILNEYPELVEEWLSDMQKVAELIPQGELVHINERGDYENLILKAKERLCTTAQLEVMRNTKETIERIIKNTDNDFVRKDLEKINTGARCTSGFNCPKPCAFKEGIDLSRII